MLTMVDVQAVQKIVLSAPQINVLLVLKEITIIHQAKANVYLVRGACLIVLTVIALIVPKIME